MPPEPKACKQGRRIRAAQRVTAAHTALSDAAARAAYDRGDELPRELERDGSQGPDLFERVTRDYFPERFGYEPFGDPFEVKREQAERRRQRAPEQPNAADIPDGTYRSSCHGCALADGGARLRCTQCVNTRRQRVESDIALSACAEDEVIGNRDGVLTCEIAKRPELGPGGGDAQGGAPGDDGPKLGPKPGHRAAHAEL